MMLNRYRLRALINSAPGLEVNEMHSIMEL